MFIRLSDRLKLILDILIEHTPTISLFPTNIWNNESYTRKKTDPRQKTTVLISGSHLVGNWGGGGGLVDGRVLRAPISNVTFLPLREPIQLWHRRVCGYKTEMGWLIMSRIHVESPALRSLRTWSPKSRRGGDKVGGQKTPNNLSPPPPPPDLGMNERRGHKWMESGGEGAASFTPDRNDEAAGR